MVYREADIFYNAQSAETKAHLLNEKLRLISKIVSQGSDDVTRGIQIVATG